MFETNSKYRKVGITKTVYTLIIERKYDEVCTFISNYKDAYSTRACLSLLGYSFYNSQQYIEAANCYEHLCLLHPKEERYRLYYAQSLYQSGIFEEALRICEDINSDELKISAIQLQCAIYYSMEEYSKCQAALALRPEKTADVTNDEGCLLFQAESYEEANKRFQLAVQIGGFNPLMVYNIALCHYKLKQKSQALDNIAELMERCARNNLDFGLGSQLAVLPELPSPSNTFSMSGLTQAINLKAALEYKEDNANLAREILMEMPLKTESELDPVTLHNMALTDQNGPGSGLKRLAFLLELGPPICPNETFANIVLLCCKHEFYDTAADILAENAHLTYKYLSEYLYDLLDALITAQSSTENAEKKLLQLSFGLTASLRNLAAKVQEARGNTDQNVLRHALKEYEDTLENYLPVVLSKAWLSWREDDFATAEKEFRSSAEFCSENSIWRLHAAHVLFMQGKYKEAAAFYEPIVRQNLHDIISVSAAVLANLCVSYIMTFLNEEAEELMRKVEKAEDLRGNTDKQCLHLCIVNLVVGTLYCSKNNFEFGLSRIAHALEGDSGERLCADTWLHVKRCLLGLLTGLAKQIVVLPYPAIQEVLNFLQTCEVNGLYIPSNIHLNANDFPSDTIGLQARKLRIILKKLAEHTE